MSNIFQFKNIWKRAGPCNTEIQTFLEKDYCCPVCTGREVHSVLRCPGIVTQTSPAGGLWEGPWRVPCAAGRKALQEPSRRLDAQKPRTVSLQGSSTDEVYSSASLQGRNAPAFLVGPQRVDLELRGIE